MNHGRQATPQHLHIASPLRCHHIRSVEQDVKGFAVMNNNLSNVLKFRNWINYSFFVELHFSFADPLSFGLLQQNLASLICILLNGHIMVFIHKIHLIRFEITICSFFASKLYELVVQSSACLLCCIVDCTFTYRNN